MSISGIVEYVKRPIVMKSVSLIVGRQLFLRSKQRDQWFPGFDSWSQSATKPISEKPSCFGAICIPLEAIELEFVVGILGYSDWWDPNSLAPRPVPNASVRHSVSTSIFEPRPQLGLNLST